MVQQDQGWGQPGLLVVGHDVAIAIVFPDFVRDGFYIEVNVAEGCRKGERQRFTMGP